MEKLSALSACGNRGDGAALPCCRQVNSRHFLPAAASLVSGPSSNRGRDRRRRIHAIRRSRRIRTVRYVCGRCRLTASLLPLCPHLTRKHPHGSRGIATMAATAAAVLLLPTRLVSLQPQPGLSFPNRNRLALHSLASLGRRGARLRAVGDRPGAGLADQTTVYNGVYGPWTVEDSDVREVLLYRSGLVTAAASFVAAASAAFLPEGNAAGDAIRQSTDLFYAAGAAGLGLSLVLIHIYVTPIKRFLQALWAVGVLGSVGTYLAAAQPLDQSLTQYVLEHPAALWFVGPTFAALTGLVFKEGLCYGKLEAGILTFVIPGLLLGHLSGLMDDGTKSSLLGVWMVLFTIFAARKFQQPIKDDIGDKSVFMFNALPEEEKNALIQKLERQTE